MTHDCVTMNQFLGNYSNTPRCILHITKLCVVKSAQRVFYYILLKHRYRIDSNCATFNQANPACKQM